MPESRVSGGRDPSSLAEHFFRHESGRLVSVLTRVLGVRHIDLVEDVVQAAFLQALGSWGVRGVPDDPGAWLFRVARNRAVDTLRRARRVSALVDENVIGPGALAELLARTEGADEIDDDQLRMLALCCHPALSPESQVALALRMLGGFSAAEIARALLTSESNAEKRITRAKAALREESLGEMTPAALRSRLPAVQSVVYLLFNEGYSSCREAELVRAELCDEAIRLGSMLVSHAACRTPAACALMALMYFHAARLEVRESDDGRMLLLDEQPRERWHAGSISQGLEWLRESASGEELSPYHLEAAIAAEHTLAPTFAQTNWARVLSLYDMLVKLHPSAVRRLNRGIAVAYVHGPQAGLNALAAVDPAEIPRGYHLWDAVLGELHRRAGDHEQAREHLKRALEFVRTSRERDLIRSRLEASGGT